MTRSQKGWQAAEAACASHLNSKYSLNGIVYSQHGGSDSTVSDIAVQRGSEHLFYFEAKTPSSQSGQFVIIDNGARFAYSEGNRSPLDAASEAILSIVNDSYETHTSVSTNNTILPVSAALAHQWIEGHYIRRGVKFFIVKNDNGYLVFPVNRLHHYYDVETVLRRKRSGSGNLAVKNRTPFVEDYQSTYGREVELIVVGRKTFLDDSALPSGPQIMQGPSECRYYIAEAKMGSNLREVRQLSGTNNPSVVFSLKLRNKTQDASDMDDFLSVIGQ